MTTRGHLTFGVAVAGAALALSAVAFTTSATAKMPKHKMITMNQAEAIAVEARRGAIKSEKVRHKGKPNMQYAFVIQSVGKKYIVDVSGKTGDVTKNMMKSN